MRIYLTDRIKISLVLIISVLAVTGCSQKQSGQGTDLLTIDKVVKVFQDSGIKIKEDNTIKGENFELNGVTPFVFI